MVHQRKIVVSLAISADGFIARSDGAVDWLDRPDPEDGYGMAGFYQSIDTILWGRKTFDTALEVQKRGVPGSAFDTRMKNFVFTRTLTPSSAPEGVEFINEPVREFAGRLRKEPGKDIWMMGGAGIIASFLDEGAIDEFVLNVIPIFIGEGIPLMAPRHRTVPLQLAACKPYPDGVVQLHYAVESKESETRSNS